MGVPVYECDISQGKCCGTTDPICHAGNIGNYAVQVTSALDVQIAVQWASLNNVALSVKTTGHDWHGKSTNKDTLNIWMHGMKGVTYFEEWSSEECDANGPPQKAMEVLGGNQWIDVYNVMREKGVIVVGGGAPSVSATGGYL